MLLFITRKFEETFENTDNKSQLVAIFCSEREPSVILIAILNNPGSGNAAVRGCQKEKCCSRKNISATYFCKNSWKFAEIAGNGIEWTAQHLVAFSRKTSVWWRPGWTWTCCPLANLNKFLTSLQKLSTAGQKFLNYFGVIDGWGHIFRWQKGEIWDFVFEFTVGTQSQSTDKSWNPLKEMYHKIETNDDGDVSMKQVVIHIKGGNSRLADFNQMSNVLIKPKTSQVYFQKV